MNQEYKVHLSQGQKAKLAKAIRDGSALKLRLGKNALSGNDELLLSPRQIAKLQKAKRNNSGVEISFSKSSIRKSVKHGGSLWTSLFSLGTKALPFVTKGVSKVAPHLATGALSALGSLGIDKIFGSGTAQATLLPDAIVKMLQKGIEIPVKFLVNLINMKEMLTNAQKTLIGKGLQSGKGIVLKPTKRQIHGGLLGTLAAIGIPMAIELASKIFGSGAGQGLQTPRKAGGSGAGQGLQTPRKAGTGVGQGLQVSQKPFLWQPPPFYGTWEGQGRGAKGKGLLLGDNSPFNHIPILGAIL